MRVIICGSRFWDDITPIRDTITRLRDLVGKELVVVHGAAAGADRIADMCAKGMGVTVEPHPADWERYGKGAGPIRNRVMLHAGPHLVVAFKDDFDWTVAGTGRGGTEDMVHIARDALIPTAIYTHASGVIVRSSFNATIVDAVDRWRNPATLFEGTGT